MPSQLQSAISDTDVETFWRDGVICLRQAFSRSWVEELREATDKVLNDGSRQRTVVTADGGRFSADNYLWLQNETFRRHAFESPAAAIAARLLRATQVNLLYDQLLVKEPGTPTPLSWHQDGPSWPLQGEQALSLWMPMDPVTVATGGVVYARGQHLGPHYGCSNNVVKAGQFMGESADPCPDFATIDGGALLVSWDVEPGDCLVHHMWTPHATGGNHSPTQRRRAHTTRWAGESCRFRAGRFQLRPLIDPQLGDGAPLAWPLYPAVSFASDWQGPARTVPA